MIGDEAVAGHLNAAAEVLETRFEKILAAYEERLLAMGSPLVAEADTREQLREQARSVLEEVAANLRGRGTPSGTLRSEDPLSETIGASRARGNVHAIESLRAVAVLSEAALMTVVEGMPQSRTPSRDMAAIALVIQKTIMERVTRASVSYGKFAKRTAQETFEVTRALSMELRNSSAGEGLEVALSDLLRTSVPPDIRSWVSVEGDESVVAPHVRDELFLILREGIRNAVTHSGARTIKVELDTNDNRIKAAVEDDGCGFESGEEATGGTGLASMKERASLLGGTLDMASVPDRGTRVEIFLPLPGGQRSER